MGLADLFAKKIKGNTQLAENLPIVVTTIAGNTFVSGLYWQKLEKVNNFMSEARRRAKQPEMAGMAIVAIRESDISVQAGFAPHRAGANKGAYSMASAVAGQLGHSFLAALPDGKGMFVFVACHKGAILQGGDLVLPEEEVEVSLAKMLSRMRLANSKDSDQSRVDVSRDARSGEIKIFAPDSFGIDGSQERTLDDVLTAKVLRREYKLKQLAIGGLSPKELRSLALAAVVGAGIIYAGYFIYDEWHQRNLVALNAQAREQAVAEAKRLAGIQQGATPANVPTLPHPWLRSPPISEFLQICEEQIGKLPMAIAGRDLKHGDCSMGHLTADYESDGSSFATLNNFKAELWRLFKLEPDPRIKDAGKTVSFTAGFKTPEFKVTDGPAPAENGALWDTISYFQGHAGAVAITKQDLPAAQAPTSTLPGQKAPPTPIQDWTTYTIEVDNSDKTPDFILADYPVETARLISISFDRNPTGGQDAWTIKGELYVH